MESGLKQRLVGALVLIVAAVIFLPMLLTGQDETVEIDVEVPEPVAVPMPETRPAPELQPREPAQVAEIPPRDAVPEPEVLEQPQPPVAVEPPPPAAAPETPAELPAPSGDWVIQLGSFGNADNASGLASRLREQGYNAYTHEADSDGQRVTRVFVGPLASREAATRLQGEIKRNQAVEGFVTSHDASTGRL